VPPLSAPAAVALGLAASAVAFCSSPAAAVAVLDGARAEGPMARTVMSAVVFKDVLAVLAFALAVAYASFALGAGEPGRLGPFVLRSIVASLLAGGLLGGIMAAYLRFVGQELLLFLLGAVFLASYVAARLGLEPILLFLAAGFAVSNLARAGDKLLRSVEALSRPVYVIFFAFVGATLPVHLFVAAAPFALAFALVRTGAIWAAAHLGARMARADEATQRHGWTGFVAQAGLAIVLATRLGDALGPAGQAVAAILLSAMVVHAFAGPVLLKVGLGLARELPATRAPEPAETEGAPPPEDRKRLTEWPLAVEAADVWGGLPGTQSRELNDRLMDLQSDLQAVVRDVASGPLEDFRHEGEMFLRELRREYLRHHRRLAVRARSDEDRKALATELRTQQAQLAERWRGIVLGRAVRLRKAGWTPDALVASVDRVVDALPPTLRVPWEPECFQGPAEGAPTHRVRRVLLRARRAARRLFGLAMPERSLELRALARYHLSGLAPERLEGLAALLVHSDRHLALRTRSLFDVIVDGYDALAARLARDEAVDVGEALVDLRREVEEELALALDEVARMVDDGTHRTEIALGDALRSVKGEVPRFGTFDLPASQRRSSRLFRQRMRALETLTSRLRRVRRTSAAGYASLALELELVGLMAQVKDTLEAHVEGLERDVRGRTHRQVVRVRDALQEALMRVGEILKEERTGDQIAVELRQVAEATERVAGEAGRAAAELRDRLADEGTAGKLLDALARATRELTDRYEVASGRVERGEWKLPAAVDSVEVPFRELVQTWVDTRIAPALMTTVRDMSARVQPLATSLAELERLVAFNVELATGELEVVQEERVPKETRTLLHDMVTGTLDRSLGMVQGYVEATAQWSNDVGRDLREAVLGGIESLRAQLVDAPLSKARVDALRRSMAGRRLMREAGQFRGFVSRMRSEVGRAVQGIAGEDRLESWRRFLGLPASHRPLPAGQDAFAPPKVPKDIPLVYRRLFAADTLEAGDVLTGRELQIARTRRVLEGRAQGRLRSVALVGHDGVGKGAISGAIVRSRNWKGVRRVHPTAPMTVKNVEAIFRERTDGHLVVVDGLHWMLAMRPGGFEPLRRFVQGVIEDAGRNAWLVHGDLLFWQYASHVAPLDDAFPEVVHLDPLSADALQAAVLARHALSGCGLSFETTPGGTWLERAFARGLSRLQRPYDRYFRDLHTASGGLVRDALRLWLASIDRVEEEQDFVHVGHLPTPPAAALRRLPEPLLLQLYPIARQGWMSAEVQAHVFRVDATTAQAQLAHLHHLGLLEEHGEGVFRIAVHLRGAIVRVLEDRGWVR
jgi:Kef-type K+ transport system membrane component KefB